MQASTLRGHRGWFLEICEQRTFGGTSPSDWSFRWLDVCTCTDAPEKGLRIRGL